MKQINLFIYFFSLTSFIYSQDFSLGQIKSYPFPNELTGSQNSSRIAWAFDEQGKRNIYVAEGKDYIPYFHLKNIYQVCLLFFFD